MTRLRKRSTPVPEYALLQRPSIQVDGVTYSVELYWPSADDDASLAKTLADANCAAIGRPGLRRLRRRRRDLPEASLPMHLPGRRGREDDPEERLLLLLRSLRPAGSGELANWALEQELTRGAVIDCITDPTRQT